MTGGGDVEQRGELHLIIDGFAGGEDEESVLEVHPPETEFNEDHLFVDKKLRQYYIPYDSILGTYSHI